jgi:hypothetical protein
MYRTLVLVRTVSSAGADRQHVFFHVVRKTILSLSAMGVG